MKKIIWVCGVIAGIISVSWGVLSEGVIGDSLSLTTRMIFGYATMVLAFSLIFVGIKNYRDNYSSGHITFGKALGIGLLITLIASTVYVVIWMIDFSYFVPDFGAKYQTQAIAEMKANGVSAAEIQKQSAEMAATFETYNTNAAFRVMFTYMEIAPVGMVMSLIAALVLKRKSKPATVKRLITTDKYEKSTGLGGVFFKSNDPKGMNEWYAKNLGLTTSEYGVTFDWLQADEPSKKGTTAWCTFPQDTKYFNPSEKPFMINYRVENLVALLEELKKDNVTIVDEIAEYDYGKFVHILDPEGNIIELWEPMGE